MKEKTKDKILRAARTLFSQKGFHGVKTQDIAQEANVNHGLIFHHFKNKESLWQATKESIATLYAKTHPTLDPTQPFGHFLDQFIDYYIHFYQKNPLILKMIVWQNIEFSPSKLPFGGTSDSFKHLISIFEGYQKKNAIHPNINVKFTLIFILTTIMTYVETLPPLLSKKEHIAYAYFLKESLKKLFEQ